MRPGKQVATTMNIHKSIPQIHHPCRIKADSKEAFTNDQAILNITKTN